MSFYEQFILSELWKITFYTKNIEGNMYFIGEVW